MRRKEEELTNGIQLVGCDAGDPGCFPAKAQNITFN
jgi:hypothetical protein